MSSVFPALFLSWYLISCFISFLCCVFPDLFISLNHYVCTYLFRISFSVYIYFFVFISLFLSWIISSSSMIRNIQRAWKYESSNCNTALAICGSLSKSSGMYCTRLMVMCVDVDAMPSTAEENWGRYYIYPHFHLPKGLETPFECPPKNVGRQQIVGNLSAYQCPLSADCRYCRPIVKLEFNGFLSISPDSRLTVTWLSAVRLPMSADWCPTIGRHTLTVVRYFFSCPSCMGIDVSRPTVAFFRIFFRREAS